MPELWDALNTAQQPREAPPDMWRAPVGVGSPAESAGAPSGMSNLAAGLYQYLGNLAKRSFGASEEMRGGGAYNPAPIVETTLSAAGGALPWAEKGAAGIFGGRLAKTADLGALAKAEELATQGHAPAHIWDETGWFQGADKKWRFEIPDQQSYWKTNPTGLPQNATTQPIGDVFHHPGLYAAYPEASEIDLGVRQLGSGSRAQFQPGHWGDPPTITLSPTTPASMRSSTLHELQHGVQDIEGFATGGNMVGLRPGTPSWDIYQERLKAIRTPVPEAELRKSGVIGDEYTYADYLREHQQTIKNDKLGLDRAAQEYAVGEGYKRLAGEVEARNVQRRADWSPEELKVNTPGLSQDVPYSKQFVKFREP